MNNQTNFTSLLYNQTNFKETNIISGVALGVLLLALTCFLCILMLTKWRATRNSNVQSDENPQQCTDSCIPDFTEHNNAGNGGVRPNCKYVNTTFVNEDITETYCNSADNGNEIDLETGNGHQSSDVNDYISDSSVYLEVESHIVYSQVELDSIYSEVESHDVYSEAESHSVHSEDEPHSVYSQVESHSLHEDVEHFSISQYQNIGNVGEHITNKDNQTSTEFSDSNNSNDSGQEYVNSDKSIDSPSEASASQDTTSDSEDPRSSHYDILPNNTVFIRPEDETPESVYSSKQKVNYVNVTILDVDSSVDTVPN